MKRTIEKYNIEKLEGLKMMFMKKEKANKFRIYLGAIGREERENIFIDRLTSMLDYLMPKYIKEGKSHLTIGIACSGGKHRSVTFVNGLYDYYKKSHDFEVIKHHRDIDK